MQSPMSPAARTEVFGVRVTAYGFPNNQTGPAAVNSLEAPVTVHLSGAIDAQGEIDSCRQLGTQRLSCQRQAVSPNAG